MNRVNSWIELLGGWSLGRPPRTSDARHMIGSWAAKAMLSFIVFEWVVQLGWNGHSTYSYAANYVSDLGAVHCGDIGNPAARYVCSPSYAAMDLALIFIGVSVVVAACLITSPVLWIAAHAGDLDQAYKGLLRAPHGKIRIRPSRFAIVTTTIIRWSLALSGLAIFTIGAFPEDYPDGQQSLGIHETGVRVLVAGIVVTLISIGVLWYKRTDASLWFFGLAAVAGVSAVLLAFTSGTTQLSGLFERGVIYSFIAGLVILGFMLSSAAQHEREGHLQPRTDGLPWAPRQWDRRIRRRPALSPVPEIAMPAPEAPAG
jgi:hypothetical protein